GLRMLESAETQMEYLAAFVRSLVGMVVHASIEVRHQEQQQQMNYCDAARQVAMALEDFLRKPKQPPSLGII
ncbi:hypothetical protein Gpo141_00014573, partial [Globisporangium polare]